MDIEKSRVCLIGVEKQKRESKARGGKAQGRGGFAGGDGGRVEGTVQ